MDRSDDQKIRRSVDQMIPLPRDQRTAPTSGMVGCAPWRSNWVVEKTKTCAVNGSQCVGNLSCWYLRGSAALRLCGSAAQWRQSEEGRPRVHDGECSRSIQSVHA